MAHPPKTILTPYAYSTQNHFWKRATFLKKKLVGVAVIQMWAISEQHLKEKSARALKHTFPTQQDIIIDKQNIQIRCRTFNVRNGFVSL
jgi:hypothetical protein